MASYCRTALLLALFGVCFVTAQQFQRPSALSKDCAAPSSPASVNYFPSQYFLVGSQATSNPGYQQISVGNDYVVQYWPNYKVVTNIPVNETYVLYPCNTPKPDASNFPAGTKFFSIPLASVSVPDVTAYGFLEVLNVTDRVASVPASIVTPCGQALLQCNRTSIDISAIIESPAVVLTPAQTAELDAIFHAWPYSNSNPLVVSMSAREDREPLTRVEWIKFLGLFFNKEREASDYFTKTADTYNGIAQNITQVVDSTSTTVAWIFSGSDLDFYDVDFGSYRSAITQAAGARLLSFDDTLAVSRDKTSAPFGKTTVEFSWNRTGTGFPDQASANAALKQLLKKVDVVIDQTPAADPTNYDLQSFLNAFNITPEEESQLPFLTSMRVLRTDGLVSESMASAWEGGAVVRPQLVLRDLFRGIHPTLTADKIFNWIRNIALGETVKVVTAATCTTPTPCNGTAAAQPICPLATVCTDGSVRNRTMGTACSYNCPAGAPASAPLSSQRTAGTAGTATAP